MSIKNKRKKSAINQVLSGHSPKVNPADLAADTESMTGLMVSLDDGQTWQSSGGVRVMFHDANEGDDGMEDLLVNITTEGIILDLYDQKSGEVLQTATCMVDDLIEMTT